MDRNDLILLIAVGILGTSTLLVWAIVAGAFAMPPNAGWIYHYQTLIAGLAALAAALITVRVMRQQIDLARADEADRALTRYASAIMDVMQRQRAATPPDENESLAVAKQRLEALDAATDHPTMRAAMMDNVLGMDLPMVAFFVNCCRFSAVGRVYDREDQRRHTNMIWPLYIALTNGINHRRALLRAGARVDALYALSTISHSECHRAFVEDRTPSLEELDRSDRGRR